MNNETKFLSDGSGTSSYSYSKEDAMQLVKKYGKHGKSIWNQRGGTLGKIVMVAGIIGGVALVVAILPFLISLATNVLTLGVLCGVIAGLWILISSKRFRENFSNLYFMLMRKITDSIIKVDPIAVMQRKIIEMKQRVEDMRCSAIEMRRQYISNNRKISEKKAKIKMHLAKASAYQEKGMITESNLEASQATFQKQIADRYIKNNEDVANWIKMLDKLIDYADYTVKKNSAEVEFRTEEYLAIKEQHKAFSNFKSITNVNEDDMGDFMKAMNVMADDMDSKIAEMDYYLSSTGGLMANMEIEQSLIGDDAKVLLDSYQKGGFEAVFPAFKDVAAIDGTTEKHEGENALEGSETAQIAKEVPAYSTK